MTLTERDRRALLLLGFAAIGTFVYVLITDSTAPGEISSPSDQINTAEKRLQKMRQTMALVPAREEVYKQVSAQLAAREKRLLQADTAAQAQAQLRQILVRVARGVDIRASEFGAVRPFGAEYAEVPVTVTVECPIEQLVNMVADLTAQPEAVALNELRIYSANQKQKTNNVRLTVSAIVPKRLLPDRKGSAS